MTAILSRLRDPGTSFADSAGVLLDAIARLLPD